MFTIFTVKDKEYKLRLNAKNCIDLEKRLKTNPLNIFSKMGAGELPTLEQILIILHCSIVEFQNGITMEDMYNLWNDYIEDGGNYQSILEVIIEVFKAAGFIPKDTDPNL